MEPKPFASLSAGLLARKGAARPAMRRPYVPASSGATLPSAAQDDLGWNDMGEDRAPASPPPPLKMVKEGAPSETAADKPKIVIQQARLAEQLVEPASQATAAAATARKAKAIAASKPRGGKAAFTLRLDPDRHLRLRLACAVANRSAQQIVTEALDAFLNSQPQVESLAKQVPGINGADHSEAP